MKTEMFRKFRSFYAAQSFAPGIIGVFVNPFYLARRELYLAMLEGAKDLRGDLIDVGCGTKPYKSLFKVRTYCGLDIDSNLTRQRGVADVLYDGGRFPFPSSSFDSAICNQVLEHVFNPDEFLSEIHRVLRSNGKLLLTVPFVWDEHEQPYDYGRYSSYGLRAILERNRFKIVYHKKLCNGSKVIFQLANGYIFKITQNWPKIVRIGLTGIVGGAINVFGLVFCKMLPTNLDLFLDNVVLVEKI